MRKDLKVWRVNKDLAVSNLVITQLRPVGSYTQPNSCGPPIVLSGGRGSTTARGFGSLTWCGGTNNKLTKNALGFNLRIADYTALWMSLPRTNLSKLL